VVVERRRIREEKAEAEAARAEKLRTAFARKTSGSARAIEYFRQFASREARKLDYLIEVAPRLIEPSYFLGLTNLARVPWIREIHEWKPRGKGREKLFRGLSEHLLARYRMPSFVWSAFFTRDEEGACSLIEFVAHVAAGGSAFDLVKSGAMPVPLTRKMCHELLTITGEVPFLEAIRSVQVKACGGDARFLRAWMATPQGRSLGTSAEEEFWFTVLHWFCANPMLPMTEVGPLSDYLAFRRREDGAFSMKGRSVLAVQRAMREWHTQMHRVKITGGRDRSFRPSGFSATDWDRSYREKSGENIHDVWHIREALDGKTLADEGRAMSHCVYSYAGLIASGKISIWMLTNENKTGHWRRLTIEVDNVSRRIVQARGRFNKLPEARDLIILKDWAAKNRLELSVGS